jgi:hypothetical protein
MTEEKGVGVNQDAIETFAQALIDYYNFLLTGQGFEEFVTRSVILKETGVVGGVIQITDVLIALSMFHANALFDLETKIKLTPDQVTEMRRRTVNALASILEER